MQGLMEQVPFSLSHIQTRPIVLSFDSGDECSLEHWFEVYRLVEDEDLVILEADADVDDWT